MAVYLDASAAVKLVVREAESTAIRAWLGADRALTSSALVHPETLRAVRREEPGRLEEARAALAAIAMLAVDDEILESAAMLQPLSLRSLDAIHLATALRLADELESIVTYDRRMIEGARLLGLPVATPA
ncbi:MAG: type II toxin-antitoxin system VapC family toxin [Candidatus Limnocylindria bacterium]